MHNTLFDAYNRAADRWWVWWWWCWGRRRGCCACPPPPTVLRRRRNIWIGCSRCEPLLGGGSRHSTTSSIAQLPSQSTPTRDKQVTVIPKSQNGESILHSITRITLLNCNPSLPTSVRPILGAKFVRKVLKFCIFLPELPALRCAAEEGKVELRPAPLPAIFPLKLYFSNNFKQGGWLRIV